jgi:hypothetical protein
MQRSYTDEIKTSSYLFTILEKKEQSWVEWRIPELESFV